MERKPAFAAELGIIQDFGLTLRALHDLPSSIFYRDKEYQLT
jgi:hypothetical protein